MVHDVRRLITTMNGVLQPSRHGKQRRGIVVPRRVKEPLLAGAPHVAVCRTTVVQLLDKKRKFQSVRRIAYWSACVTMVSQNTHEDASRGCILVTATMSANQALCL